MTAELTRRPRAGDVDRLFHRVLTALEEGEAVIEILAKEGWLVLHPSGQVKAVRPHVRLPKRDLFSEGWEAGYRACAEDAGRLLPLLAVEEEEPEEEDRSCSRARDRGFRMYQCGECKKVSTAAGLGSHQRAKGHAGRTRVYE
jgi:hypothetical protein